MPGFAVLPFGLVWQAKATVAEKKAAEVAAQVRSPTLDAHSCLIDYGLFTHTVRCVGRLHARARVGGGGDRVCDRIAVVVDNMTARLARPPHTHTHTHTHTYARTHTHTHTVMD